MLKGCVLWKSGIEVRQKFRIQQMKQARGVVGHWVANARDIVVPRHVSVISLVNTEETQEVSWGFFSRSAAFALPKEGSKIVGTAEDGSFPDVVVLAEGF